MRGDEQWVQKWVVPSSSGGGDYIVSLHKDGHYACSCIGWTRHTPRTDCRHIREVKDDLWPTEAEHIARVMSGNL